MFIHDYRYIAYVLLGNMDEDNDALHFLMITSYWLKHRKSKRAHSWWVHPILQGRQQYGAYHHLIQEFENDEERFQTFFRLSQDQFAEVLSCTAPFLQKYSRCREVIDQMQRLCICLRWLLFLLMTPSIGLIGPSELWSQVANNIYKKKSTKISL